MTEVLDDFYVDEAELLPANGVQPPTGNYDRYILPSSDGKAKEMTRTTTIASGMDDGYGLGTWSLYRAIWGIAQREDLIALLRAISLPAIDEPASRATLKEVADKAKLLAGTDSSSNWGTAAHGVLQRVDQGESEATIHPYWHPLVANYRAELEREGLTVVPGFIERVCWCARYDIGGRFDNAYQESDGAYVIGDKKTKGDPDDKPLSVSMQLGIYANSECVMDYTTGRYEAMLPVRKDYGVMVHIDRDTMAVEILRVNIAHGWECVRVEIERRELRKRKQLVFPYARGVGAAAMHGFEPTDRIPMNVAADRLQAQVDPPQGPPAAPANGQPNPEIVAAVQRDIYGRINQSRTAGAPEVGPGTGVTVGPHHIATAPPTPQSYAPASTPSAVPTAPVVDPDMRVQEILALRKNDKARLQGWARALGCADLNHHRKWLAEWIAKATPGSGAIEPSGETSTSSDSGTTNVDTHPSSNADAGLPPAPATPPGQPVIGPGTPHPVTSGIDAQPPTTTAGLSADPSKPTDMTIDQAMRDLKAARSMDVIARIYTQWTNTYGAGSWTGPIKQVADEQANFIRSQPPAPVTSGDDGPPF